MIEVLRDKVILFSNFQAVNWLSKFEDTKTLQIFPHLHKFVNICIKIHCVFYHNFPFKGAHGGSWLPVGFKSLVWFHKIFKKWHSHLKRVTLSFKPFMLCRWVVLATGLFFYPRKFIDEYRYLSFSRLQYLAVNNPKALTQPGRSFNVGYSWSWVFSQEQVGVQGGFSPSCCSTTPIQLIVFTKWQQGFQALPSVICF